MNSELARRVALTLGALLVFRIGTFVPLPGIDPVVWSGLFRSGGRLLEFLDSSSGGAIARVSIFALGIVPYVSAAIVIQVIGLFFRRYRLLLNTGARGFKRIQAYTRALAAVIALIQSYGVASALDRMNEAVAWHGPLFVVATTLTLTAGSLFLIWLADQITNRGIGNGIALILSVGIITLLPRSIASAFDLVQRGQLTENQLAAMALIAALLTAFVVLMERARRPLAVTYRAADGGETSSSLDFKLNTAGIIPLLLAEWVIAIPLIAAVFGSDRIWWESLRRSLQHGEPLYMLCLAVLVFFFVYLYTAFVVDPNDAAEKLARFGGTVPQVAPGEATAEYIDNVVSRVTLIGAVYFVAICLIPEVLLYRFDLPFYLGGTSLLILVCTVIDIEKQARSLAPDQAGG